MSEKCITFSCRIETAINELLQNLVKAVYKIGSGGLADNLKLWTISQIDFVILC
ncbi:MAG: hypothetical protein LBE18_11970 [Planctomycetaceae bacterium]|jgi:hypothetical protein|nr:hypothetical protein [Planctomycetaceae bacterium]